MYPHLRRAPLAWLPLLTLLLSLVAPALVAPAPVAAATPIGAVWAWGKDAAGELGDRTIGNPASTAMPQSAAGLVGASAVASGLSTIGDAEHSLALLGGVVWSWGKGTEGQLGNGARANNPTPLPILSLSGVTAIAAGENHSLALKGDKTVWAWGYDYDGQIGDGHQNSYVTAPVQVGGLGNVAAIAGGAFHSLALKGDGTVWAWGKNDGGQLGATTAERCGVNLPQFNLFPYPCSTTPVQVAGLTGVSAIAAEYVNAADANYRNRSLALKADGTVWQWGYTGAASQAAPAPIAGLSGVVALARGAALKGDGSVWTTDPAPVRIAGLPALRTIDHRIGIATDGAVWTWDEGGANAARVPGIAGASAVSGGGVHFLIVFDPTFGDLGNQSAAAVEAIRQLAARGVINGCDRSANPPLFCPDEPTLRHQMAALIVRAIPGWSAETGQPTFTDNTDDVELMTRVATLQRHNVVRGYQDEVCRARGKQPPCYGPLDNVTYGQAILFIARAMVEKGYWTLADDDRTIFPDQNGPLGAPADDQQTKDHRMIVTYVKTLGAPPDVQDVHANFAVTTASGVKGWADPTPRAWFARALWPALRPA